MTRHLARTFVIAGGLALLLPGPALAQRVQIDARATTEAGQDLRDALREVAASIAAAVRDISADVAKELGHIDRDVARDVSKGVDDGLRGLSEMAKNGAWQSERNWNAKADDRQTRTLAIGANGTLHVSNLSGDVRITAGGGRDASVEIIRRSRGRTEADARLGLERVKADVQVVGTRAIVKADYPNERNSPYSLSIDYVITAPAGTRVSVSNVSGDIVVTGIKGELSVKTISGSVSLNNVGTLTEAKTASGDLKITGASTDGTLDVGTLNGDLVLSGIKARRLTASTVSGDISARDVTADSAELNTVSGDLSYSGPVAAGGRYSLTTHSGDVVFSPSGGAGFAVTATSINGEVSSSVTLQSSGGRNRRQSMTGTVGDGSATVALKTFSGDITVGAKRK